MVHEVGLSVGLGNKGSCFVLTRACTALNPDMQKKLF